MKIFQKQLTK